MSTFAAISRLNHPRHGERFTMCRTRVSLNSEGPWVILSIAAIRQGENRIGWRSRYSKA